MMSDRRTHAGEPIDAVAMNELVSVAFSEHAAAIHRIALHSTRDPELAADVTQDAFVRLLAEAQAGRYPDNVGAWLYRATSNLIISRARRTAVARRLAPRLIRSSTPAEPDAIALRHEQGRDLQRALATLAPVERVALLMAAEGANGIEIAAALGRSNAAARTLLCRARVHLRAALAKGTETAAQPARREIPILLPSA